MPTDFLCTISEHNKSIIKQLKCKTWQVIMLVFENNYINLKKRDHRQGGKSQRRTKCFVAPHHWLGVIEVLIDACCLSPRGHHTYSFLPPVVIRWRPTDHLSYWKTLCSSCAHQVGAVVLPPLHLKYVKASESVSSSSFYWVSRMR